MHDFRYEAFKIDLLRNNRMIIEPLFLPAQHTSGCQFYIYRGDLECSIAPGNKRHKLKYHLQQASKKNKSILATFGGPHSNHISAFVAQCKHQGLTPLIVVRGETWAELTPTLRQAVALGALLFPCERVDYKLGLGAKIKKTIDEYYDHQVYWIPEGGAGAEGVLGCLDWANEIYSLSHDKSFHLCIASGTGTTAAGFAASHFKGMTVFSALKGASTLTQDVERQCQDAGLTINATIEGFDESLHGGFGKVSAEQLSFLKDLKKLNPNIPLDPLYTSKMVYKVNQLCRWGKWQHDQTLFIHTGGLQGWQGLPSDKQVY
ncbi:1-aminocyclopropane-1-carboxylate deaminase/D-cysteine desulfhydrase [Marinomonas ostreistagni]|uniref:Cysteine desulfhydrase n=1 Tax=Marinomonas ostreistagni TaxID=359209 RepID=A0ABS0ZFK7_9GAMM|nr:cysteine desulfhydrase [Marinomonas ostreistagni]MBJ7551948.1 cysteine desulfhydrase [Marinomonas ostreistagni]